MQVRTSFHNPAQHKIAIGVAASWIIYLIYLLTAQASPELGSWAGSPHLSTSVLLALTLSAVLSPAFSSIPLLGWWTIVYSTFFIIGFESLQLLVPGRSFQFIDIAEGVAGAAIGAMIGTVARGILGSSTYVWLVIFTAVLVLVASLFLLRVDQPESEVSCVQPVIGSLNWDKVWVHNFDVAQANEKLVSSSIGSLCMFDSEPDKPIIEVKRTKPLFTSDDHNLLLSGAGLVSSKLVGLRDALSKSGELTFGVRFKTNNLEAGRPPRLVVALQSMDKSPQMVARLIQNGSNASTTFSFQPWQGSSTVLANRLRDQYHEIVLTYDGAVQTTYFDGSLAGTEITTIEAIDFAGSELILTIGKRVDRRWTPFDGEINAIVIGSKSLSANEVVTVFNQTKTPD